MDIKIMVIYPFRLRLLGLGLSLLCVSSCNVLVEPTSNTPSPGSQATDASESPETLLPETPLSLDSGGSASQVQINHGQRLTTLDTASLDTSLPPGRLPPEIVPATSETQRQQQIRPGRHDPFASLPTQPQIIATRPSSLPGAAASVPPSRLPTIPPASVNSSPPAVPVSPRTVVPVPIASSSPSLAPVPTVPASVSAPGSAPTRAPVLASDTSPVPNTSPVPVVPAAVPSHTDSSTRPLVVPSRDNPPTPALEFSGVVQMGDRVNIIVEEPSGSRYVQVGATVGNGQFVIKAVDFQRGSTPAIILDRAGTEHVYWVGSPVAFDPTR